jgi:hypothetical protein
MLFPVFIFLMVLSPLFIPVAVTVVEQVASMRSRRSDRSVRSPRQFRPAIGWAPVAA